MANRGTVTYNGKTISTEDRDGSFSVTYNSKTLATIGAGASKTLNCSGKVMATNVVVGGKTLNCAGKLMATNVVVSVVSLFPSSPSAYNLIGTYTGNQTWTAPENGYFQIEVFGASGSGGDPSNSYAGGGGGGGGGYACSRVTLNKGDAIALTVGAVGATTSAAVNSSHNNSYDHTLQVTSGGNGAKASGKTPGSGGAGGTGSGGNYANYAGGAGGNGGAGSAYAVGAGGNGGTAGYSGGNVGGKGGQSGIIIVGGETKGEAGAAGFIKIYRGNTN